MLDYGFSLYECAVSAQPGEIQCTLPCLGSLTEEIRVSNHEAVSVVLPRDHGEITRVIKANRYLCAPVCAGDTVGEAVFFCDGKEIARVPLTADEDAEAVPHTKSRWESLQEFFAPKK